MKSRFFYLSSVLCLGVLFAASLAAVEKINKKNWMNHPEIKTIRQTCEEIDKNIQQDKLKKETSPQERTRDGFPVGAVLFQDTMGTVRKYELSGGSDDAAAEPRYYYDKSGKPRFTFQSLRAANGTDMETRIYFDEKGAVLYRDQRTKKGPGYSGGFPESIENPRDHFKSLCE